MNRFELVYIFLVFLNIVRADPGDFDEIKCGVPNGNETQDKIVNGELAKPHEFPWMVSVQVKIKGMFRHNCGGSIIHSQFILTAGHCTIEISTGEMRLAAGKVDIKEEESTQQYRNIKKVFYDSYEDNYKNDIALVQADKSFDLDQESVAPICLPTSKSQEYNVNTLTAGWGKLEEDGDLPDKLMKVQLPLLDTDRCKNLYEAIGYDYFLHDCQICTLEDKKDTCQADSGGPLMCTDKNEGGDTLYCCGIISWGAGCARKNRPSVETDVRCFVDWIKDTVKDNKY